MFELKEGNIAGEFIVNKKDEKFHFEPTKLIDVNELESFVTVKGILDQAFFQEVSKQELATQLVFIKLFEIYPKVISKQEANNMALKTIEEIRNSFT